MSFPQIHCCPCPVDCILIGCIRSYIHPPIYSLGGPQPYVPVAGYEDDESNHLAGRVNNIELGGSPGYKRARVLCSYDAKDGTELNLTSNEVGR